MSRPNTYSYLAKEDKKADKNFFQKHTSISWPLGDESFLARIEKITGKKIEEEKAKA